MSKYLVVVVVALLFATVSHSQAVLPADIGTKVNGFQDDFSSYESVADLYANGWKWFGGGTANLVDGMLYMTSSNEPNHLLYVPFGDSVKGYNGTGNDTYQEVLMHICVTAYGSDSRAGAAVRSDQRGINGLLRGTGQFHMLNDTVEWQNNSSATYTKGEWYWIRVVYDADANRVTGSYWADGTAEPEPTFTLAATSNITKDRNGWAGILVGNNAEFYVDYILIKADGLPEITVKYGEVPEPATMTLLALGGLALLRRKRA